MGMGGGGGGAASPSLEERGQMYLMANPGASRADAYKAAQSGLSPLQYDNYLIGQKMVQGDKKLGDPGARLDVKRYGLQMSDLAQGGLMVRGLGQLKDVLDAPSLAPGIQTRMASRMGVMASPVQQAAMDQQAALSQASARVGLTNQTRRGLANAQRDMRFGGINI